ncbi:nucleoside recognition domain-containing protein [Paenibacillus sp. LHD-38]|uniref:nucleoside recognition domain-containing protein n=1 Tax=Paenibacillus sp. LHD-38 TaxID=3072143 RepID=UPI00280F76D1|nr:nucleoside recognition domain-containing protein [Paenibacillus sp. LHD-38]MDQ8733404.1 nucleoside recognition domain-containing protein [Paenibacillus sp. LHD-38]
MAKTVMLAFLSILLVVAIILQPDASFQSSLQGLTVWWNIVFPGLLPFLVLFELIASFGLAHAVGSLLQPLMNRLFKLPGEASLAIVLGWMGGYPAGADAASSLRKRNLVTKQQGQRLLALAHMPNPLFMLVVIGAGFLHKPIVGVIIAAAVWISALWVMIFMTLVRPKDDAENNQAAAIKTEENRSSILQRAAEALRLGREQDGRSFGKALGDAVTASVQKLMMIGGFMIFAAVLAKLSEPLLSPLLDKAGLSFISQAFFEGHLGAYSAAIWDAPGTGTLSNAAAIAAVLAWSGLSGILQAGYSITGTDLKLLPFVVWRVVHALHALLFMLLLWKPALSLLRPILAPGALPAFVNAESFLPEHTVAVVIKAGELPLLWQFSLSACLLLALLGLFVSIILLPFRKANKSV